MRDACRVMRRSGKSSARVMSRVVGTNRLLAALPDNDRRRFLASCDRVELTSADMLQEAGTPLRHVYFPTGGFISLVTPLGACPGLEIGLVGDEGMVGVALLLGVSASPRQHFVRGSGSALRMTAASFRRELERSPLLRRRLNLYLHVKMHQFAQAAACVRFHALEARLARWLLMAHDRAHSNELHATQESVAHMLGVRRVGVTKAATSMQKLSLIRYSRGDITIVDRRGLEACSCGCYDAGKKLYDRVLGRTSFDE